MVDPKIMCRKHLMGEHVETHMFFGTLKKGIKVDGYLKNNLFEPKSLSSRHQQLSDEMIRRGYNHKSFIIESDIDSINTLKPNQIFWEINRESALNDLISRCPECRRNYENKMDITD